MKSFKKIKELILESVDLIIPRGAISIPRHKMPQIATNQYGKLFKFLNSQGISVTGKKVVCRNLRAAQSEIDRGKVLKWSKSIPEKALQKWPIITADFYCLDGNHTWLALLNADPDTEHINCFQIGSNLIDLLDRLKSFEGVTYKTIVEGKIFWDSPDHPYPLLRTK